MQYINLGFSLHPTLMNASSASAITIDVDLSLFIQLGLFVVLFLAIKPLLIDPFLRVMAEREARTEGARKSAREMDLQAADLGKDYSKHLEQVRKVAAEERERLRAESQKLESEIFRDAQNEAQRITNEGKAALEAQAKQVSEQLKQQSAALSSQIVSKVLGREVTS